jgi:hypothetical protein
MEGIRRPKAPALATTHSDDMSCYLFTGKKIERLPYAKKAMSERTTNVQILIDLDYESTVNTTKASISRKMPWCFC